MPAACTNLISGIQLDKAGVMTMLGNGSLALATNGRTIVEGKIINDMYHLHLKIVPPTTASLALWISTPSLILRLDSHAAGPDFCTA